jgi:hypothetical protein
MPDFRTIRLHGGNGAVSDAALTSIMPDFRTIRLHGGNGAVSDGKPELEGPLAGGPATLLSRLSNSRISRTEETASAATLFV